MKLFHESNRTTLLSPGKLYLFFLSDVLLSLGNSMESPIIYTLAYKLAGISLAEEVERISQSLKWLWFLENFFSFQVFHVELWKFQSLLFKTSYILKLWGTFASETVEFGSNFTFHRKKFSISKVGNFKFS